MKICENRNIKKCLGFQGLTINAEKRLAVKGNGVGYRFNKNLSS